jgi:hypothetical protein
VLVAVSQPNRSITCNRVYNVHNRSTSMPRISHETRLSTVECSLLRGTLHRRNKFPDHSGCVQAANITTPVMLTLSLHHIMYPKHWNIVCEGAVSSTETEVKRTTRERITVIHFVKLSSRRAACIKAVNIRPQPQTRGSESSKSNYLLRKRHN